MSEEKAFTLSLAITDGSPHRVATVLRNAGSVFSRTGIDMQRDGQTEGDKNLQILGRMWEEVSGILHEAAAKVDKALLPTD